jgi:serine/threonine-protein kinase RsbW
LELSGDHDGLLAAIEDEGPGYDPDSVPDPTADENLTVASGRGLALIRAFMTEVTVVEPGNRLEIRYARPAM